MEFSRSWNKRPKLPEGPPKKKRKKNTEVSVIPKNPVMALNEIKPNVEYNITGTGPPHAKTYCASVTLNGRNYSASDTTIKKAKAKVAQIILECLVQLRDPSVKTLSTDIGSVDFSQDLIEANCDRDEFFSFESTVVEKVKEAPVSHPPPDSAKNNPVYFLNKTMPGIKIEIVKEEGSPHCPIYTAQSEIK